MLAEGQDVAKRIRRRPAERRGSNPGLRRGRGHRDAAGGSRQEKAQVVLEPTSLISNVPYFERTPTATQPSQSRTRDFPKFSQVCLGIAAIRNLTYLGPQLHTSPITSGDSAGPGGPRPRGRSRASARPFPARACCCPSASAAPSGRTSGLGVHWGSNAHHGHSPEAILHQRVRGENGRGVRNRLTRERGNSGDDHRLEGCSDLPRQRFSSTPCASAARPC